MSAGSAGSAGAGPEDPSSTRRAGGAVASGAGAEAGVTQPRQVDITLLGREYRVACPAGQEGKLLEAALLLDGRMREIERGGKLLGAEKIAIMAALNIAHDFLFAETSKGFDLHEVRRRIRGIEQQLDRCFFEQDSLF